MLGGQMAGGIALRQWRIDPDALRDRNGHRRWSFLSQTLRSNFVEAVERWRKRAKDISEARAARYPLRARTSCSPGGSWSKHSRQARSTRPAVHQNLSFFKSCTKSRAGLLLIFYLYNQPKFLKGAPHAKVGIREAVTYGPLLNHSLKPSWNCRQLLCGKKVQL